MTRVNRERNTIAAMAQIYCRDKHGTPNGTCSECSSLLAYAMERLDHCVYHDNKPTCAKCPVHCYKKDRREQVRVMMRYAGPRMLFYHPYLAILHLIDGRRKTPQRPQRHNTAND